MDQLGFVDLEKRLGYTFSNPSVLSSCLTHPGYLKSPKPSSFQRHEFLGDRVLSLVVAHLLYTHFPQEKEGALSKRHAHLVRRETLALVAKDLTLERFLILPKKEVFCDKIAADSLEALIATVYLDGGFDAAFQMIETFWTPLIKTLNPKQWQDPKGRLQEWAHVRKLSPPVYETLSRSGADHQPVFEVKAEVGKFQALATGPSKKMAEHQAALTLLTHIGLL